MVPRLRLGKHQDSWEKKTNWFPEGPCIKCFCYIFRLSLKQSYSKSKQTIACFIFSIEKRISGSLSCCVVTLSVYTSQKNSKIKVETSRFHFKRMFLNRNQPTQRNKLVKFQTIKKLNSHHITILHEYHVSPPFSAGKKTTVISSKTMKQPMYNVPR